MVPAAHVSAAIEILDQCLGGAALEATITNWGRAHRFAGSGDRAAIRDLVFDAWRCKRSYAALGGADTGRGLMLGRLRALGLDSAAIFTGLGHAPAVVSDTEIALVGSELAAIDCPDWLAPRLNRSLGAQFTAVMLAMQHRAPIFLRVNLARITRDAAIALLAADGIETAAHGLAKTSLEVLTSSRKVLASNAYLEGLIELQDAASQAVVEAIPLSAGQKVLDYCAGGGGKTLALAARHGMPIWAFDADQSRMRDLPVRAKRAGADISILQRTDDHAPYDVVLVDAPCSGSGSWRRDPVGKWALTESRLNELTHLQADILDRAAGLVAPEGALVYATCSLLADENQDQIARFLARNLGWQCVADHQFTPLQGGDGFFVATLTR